MMTAENTAACHHCHVLLRSDHATPAQYATNTATPVTHCVLASSPPPITDSWPAPRPYAPGPARARVNYSPHTTTERARVAVFLLADV